MQYANLPGSNRMTMIDGSTLGEHYYALLPDWMKLVEDRSSRGSAGPLLALIYTLALADDPQAHIVEIQLERWIARLQHFFREGCPGVVAQEWLSAGQEELIELGHVQVRAARIELIWPATHSLYAVEPWGNA